LKILLVHTNDYNFGQLPKSVESQRGLNPPITLAYVAASILKSGHEVKLVDMDAENIDHHKLSEVVKQYDPDMVGLSVMLNNLIVCLELAELIKKINSDIKIIFGGIMVNLYPKSTISYESVDYGVIGEGEQTFPELLEYLEKKLPLKKVRGLVFKNNNEIIVNDSRPPIEEMDEIAYPARELLDNSKYKSLISHKSPITILFTSRGCPYQCNFCSKPSFWNKWRFHSPKYVANEFEVCADLGIKEILVYDDIFTSNSQRVRKVCEEINKKQLDISWDIRTRIDLVHRDDLNVLKKSGCVRINYGVESGDPEILKILNKGYTIEKIKNAFKISKELGFETLGYFMIGSPNETKASIMKTFKLMKELDPDYIHLTHVVPYPKTKLFDMAVQRGLAMPDAWENLENLNYDTFPMFTDGELTRKDIFNYVKKGYRTFYYRPSYIWKHIRKIRSFKELWRNVKAAFSL
jgi:radical SAM superfamily enzyme YgiQ (UPF0313 family)